MLIKIQPTRTPTSRIDCVLIITRQPRPSFLTTSNTDTASPAIDDSTSLPATISDQFRLLRTIPMPELEASTVDVDKWEIAISPDVYAEQFGSILATVRLSSHTPKRKAMKDDQPGFHFDQWLLLAESGHQLWMDQQFKTGFFTELKRWRTIQPAKTSFQASYGSAIIPVSIFVHCLNIAGCPTLRLKMYGQKLPLTEQFGNGEPAQLDHPLAKWNEWDIGVTFKASDIWLFAPTKGKTEGLTLFPMLVPSSLDYGSVLIELTHKGKQFKVKIYPRVVHVIKSFNSRLQGDQPRLVAAVRRRGKASGEMIHNLATIPAPELGGFRIEVTVAAKTLTEAEILVHATGYLSPGNWLYPYDPVFKRLQLDAKLQGTPRVWVFFRNPFFPKFFVSLNSSSKGLLTGT